jgi:hypothetical protein
MNFDSTSLVIPIPNQHPGGPSGAPLIHADNPPPSAVKKSKQRLLDKIFKRRLRDPFWVHPGRHI